MRDRREIAIAGLTLLAAVAGGCGRGPAEPEESTGGEGPRLYTEWNCAMCHGGDREGNELGPAIDELGELWDVESLTAYLLDPERFRREDPRLRALQGYYLEVTMPPFDYPVAERRKLAEWLLAPAP